jgi:hypothetical protein
MQGIVHAMMYYIYWSGTQDVLYLPVKYIGCIILLVTYTGCIVSTSHVPECEVYQPMRFTDIFADVSDLSPPRPPPPCCPQDDHLAL